MNVRVYTKEKCPLCASPLRPANDFRCPTHPKVKAATCYIQVTGVPGFPKRRMRIYSDRAGTPLYLKTAAPLAETIRKEALNGVFNPRAWDPAVKQQLLWRNYAEYYLAHMRRRAEEPPGSNVWLSRTALEDLELYQRKYLVPAFGGMYIADVGEAAISKYISTLRNTTGSSASPATRRKVAGAIRHMLNFARSEGDIAMVPNVPVVNTGSRVITTLTPAQQTEILKLIPASHRPIFEWLAATGRRVNEARAMKVKDIDFNRGEYRVAGAFDREVYKPYPKARRYAGAALPLDEKTVDIIHRALEGRVYGPDGWVFVNPRTGEHLTSGALKETFRRARLKAGYAVSLNEFGRHSWATQRLAEGWTFDHVAMFLLNSAVVVERRYANVTTAVRRSIIDMHAARAGKEKAE